MARTIWPTTLRSDGTFPSLEFVARHGVNAIALAVRGPIKNIRCIQHHLILCASATGALRTAAENFHKVFPSREPDEK
jgi:hypothetical protein